MDLIINFKGIGKITLELKQGRRLIDALTFCFNANLDTLLILTVDKILKKNRIKQSSLEALNIAGDIDQNSSAYNITQAFILALKTSK